MGVVVHLGVAVVVLPLMTVKPAFLRLIVVVVVAVVNTRVVPKNTTVLPQGGHLSGI